MVGEKRTRAEEVGQISGHVLDRSSLWISCADRMVTTLAVGEKTLGQNERELTRRSVDDNNKERFWIV